MIVATNSIHTMYFLHQHENQSLATSLATAIKAPVVHFENPPADLSKPEHKTPAGAGCH